jgi:hypothetical protein
MLAEHQVAIHLHVVYPAAAGDHLGVDVEFVLDFSRQTGGAGLVVSLLAVGNADMHANLLESCQTDSVSKLVEMVESRPPCGNFGPQTLAVGTLSVLE